MAEKRSYSPLRCPLCLWETQSFTVLQLDEVSTCAHLLVKAISPINVPPTISTVLYNSPRPFHLVTRGRGGGNHLPDTHANFRHISQFMLFGADFYTASKGIVQKNVLAFPVNAGGTHKAI